MDMNEAEARTPLWTREDSAVDRQLSTWMASPLGTAFVICPWSNSCLRSNGPSLATSLSMMRARRNADGDRGWSMPVRKHGEWPVSLQELVPALLPTVARSIGSTAGRCGTGIIDGKPWLYSVSANRQDDGGAPASLVRGGRGRNPALSGFPPPKLRSANAGRRAPDLKFNSATTGFCGRRFKVR